MFVEEEVKEEENGLSETDSRKVFDLTAHSYKGGDENEISVLGDKIKYKVLEKFPESSSIVASYWG